MKDWQIRAIEERNELDKKGEALFEFINEDDGVFDSLPKQEQIQLVEQAVAMRAYFDVLADRVSRFEN